MALTPTEEALVRQLLDQQAAILSLAGNEATITSKLGSTKVNLSDLVSASAVNDTDLLLVRQGTTDKSIVPTILRNYAQNGVATQKGVQAGDYNTSAAGGTADALTGDFTPDILTLENGLTLYVRALNANTTTTPTFSPDGLTSKPVVKGNNLPLLAGDIAGAGHWLTLQYDATLDKWLLQNPAKGVIPPASGSAVQGAFKNLSSSATGANANVAISADEIILENESNNYTTVRSVSLTLNTAGSGANGLDTGALSTSTWYYVWVIYNGSTVSALASLSDTAPTMPSGYTSKARIGAFRTDGTGNKYPLGFTQKGRKVRYLVSAGTNVTAAPQMASITATSMTSIATGGFVPTTASMIDVLAAATANNSALVAPNSSWATTLSGPTPQTTNTSLSASATSTIQVSIMLESANIYGATSGGTASFYCNGWEDNI